MTVEKLQNVMNDWVSDIAEMHTKFGVNEKVRTFDSEKLYQFLEFRRKFLVEELTEMGTAMEAKNADDVVDALIDLCVVAIGTLDAFDVDAHTAWNRVHHANMSKEVGIKEGRINPLGLPDLIKPKDWVAPTHADNVGLLEKAFQERQVTYLEVSSDEQAQQILESFKSKNV